MNFGFNLIKKNLGKFSLLMFLEFLFIFLLIMFLVLSSAKLAENYEILNDEDFNTEQYVDAKDEDLLQLQERLDLMSNSVNNVFKWYGLTVLIVFLIFGLFKGVEWLLVYNIIEKRRFNFKYLVKFYLLILIWIVVLGVFYYIINLIFKNPYLILVVIFLFYCFSSISFVLLLKDNKFLNCIKKSFKICFSRKIRIFLLILIFFIVSIFILNVLANLGIVISIIGLIWILFLISYSKLFILLNL